MATQIGGWADYTEYGASKIEQSRGWGYGWLGSHERGSMPETAGLLGEPGSESWGLGPSY